MKKYSMFRVADYKGGELFSTINEDSLGELLSELFENCSFEDITSKSSILEELKKEVNRKGFYSEYAGGEGFVGEIYEVSGSKLTSISIEKSLEEVAEYIKNNWDD